MFAQIKAYLSLIIAVAWAASIAATFFYAMGIGEDRKEADQAREQSLVQSAVDAANRVSAEAIAKIEVKNLTIRQEVQREIIERPVYRDCKHSPDVMRNINEALSPRPKPAGDSKLPRTNAVD